MTGRGDELSNSDFPVTGTLFFREPEAPRRSVEIFYSNRDALKELNRAKRATFIQNRHRKQLNRIASQLSPVWKAMRQEKNRDKRRKLHTLVRNILKQQPKNIDISDYTKKNRKK